MSNTQKLVFFNKNGYPYNFTLNNGIWNGKIFFDPNSTDIFKSISLYTLESVDSIKISDTMDIINMEIYNDSGMTLSVSTYSNLLISDITSVNQSSDFYTKWVMGENFNRKFPVGTIITFNGNIQSGKTDGESDFLNSMIFTVLNVKKNGIMISTTTPNDQFTFLYNQSLHNLKISSHSCISIPDFDKNLQTSFNVSPTEKISLYGSDDNDGVYEISQTGYSISRILDYDLSSLTTGDTITVKLKLLTDRPNIYSGDIILNGTSSLMTFINGRNSNIVIGSKFICEDNNGNYLLGGNEYEIISIITEENMGSSVITFTGLTYEEDDGNYKTDYNVIIPSSFNLKVGDNIYFKSPETGGSLNNNLNRTIINIITGSTNNTIQLNDTIHFESAVIYSIIKKIKSHEQNTVVVSTSGSIYDYNGYVRCMTLTNELTYTQQVSDKGYADVINNFISLYSNNFKFNGIDVYGLDNYLIFDGIYSGQNRYFDIDIIKNNSIIIPTGGTYTDINHDTPIYNLLLDNKLLKYERKNMSNNLSVSYYADITLDIFDDAQDYGFQLQINGIQYYTQFNDNSGSTSYTMETIKSFIELYSNVFYKNGINIWSGTTLSGSTTINHLYIQGQEPNIDIWEMKVKVNKNSSYTLTESLAKCMMITSNKLKSSTLNFLDIGYSTGMIISISGSSYTLNNKEFNIIGISDNTIELSYQGSMYTDINQLITLVSREYLRRPRESDDMDIYYRYRWEDDLNSNIFLYDLSGENLKPYGNNADYAYTGPKPLCNSNDIVILNKEINKDINYINIPSRQQTIFNQLDFKLEKFNDDNISILPKPIQTFIGYNSKNEGVDKRNLIIERVDNIMYSGYSDGILLYFTISGNTMTINGTESSTVSFLKLGFRKNRYIRIKFDDLKPYTQEIFENYQDYNIINVTDKKIFLDTDLTYFTTQNNEFNFSFEMLPERIGYFVIYGETESEDERLESNLKLLGIDLTEEDEFIFKQSDVKEDGIDYRLLNRKRKEMLNIFPDIYNYIGSYRAILNSIDFFGYNDIDLMEYYKNINPNSPYYQKLKRVLIPELTDRTVDGWTYSEDLTKNTEYIKTNLFNLTYKITDDDGNYVLLYSLKEVQTKLNGLKKWLRKNVIPINSNVRDITGLAYSPATLWRRFDPCVNITKNVVSDSNVAVNFNYMVTRSFNDSWLVSVRFYVVSGDTPDFFNLKVITYTKDTNTGVLNPQQRYDVFKTDLSNFNFSINWDGQLNNGLSDQFFYIETTTSNDRGMSKSINQMYKLENGKEYYYDEFKNYVLVNNIFRYKYYNYVQNKTNVYIIDDQGNIYIVNKDINNII